MPDRTNSVRKLMRRLVPLVILLLGVGVALYLWPGWVRTAVPGPTQNAGARSQSAAASNLSRPTPGTDHKEPARSKSTAAVAYGAANVSAYDEADFPIAAPLNAPGSSVGRDLDIVGQILDAWRSNFPAEGNPVGENAEITAALMGNNRLELALIPKGHRAVNQNGELCDRWGMPLRFHQLSGTRMEIQSAGPDRKFATADDAKWTPE